MSKFVNKYTKNMDAESLQQALAIAKELKETVEKNDLKKIKDLESSKAILLMLLEYLIKNASNPSIIPDIIIIICKFLGINISKEEEKATDKEEEEQQPEKERKEHLFRMACYEVYKLLNPNRLAGETELSNFLNNARRLGVRDALKFANPEFTQLVTKQTAVAEDIKTTGKENFVDQIDKSSKGTGPTRGIS